MKVQAVKWSVSETETVHAHSAGAVLALCGLKVPDVARTAPGAEPDCERCRAVLAGSGPAGFDVSGEVGRLTAALRSAEKSIASNQKRAEAAEKAQRKAEKLAALAREEQAQAHQRVAAAGEGQIRAVAEAAGLRAELKKLQTQLALEAAARKAQEERHGLAAAEHRRVLEALRLAQGQLAELRKGRRASRSKAQAVALGGAR